MIRYSIVRMPSTALDKDGVDYLSITLHVHAETLDRHETHIVVYKTDEFWLVDVFAGDCIDIIRAFPVCGIQEQWLPNIVHKTYIEEDDKYLLDITGYVCQSRKADEIIEHALKPIEQSNGELLYRFPSNLDWMSKFTKTA